MILSEPPLLITNEKTKPETIDKNPKNKEQYCSKTLFCSGEKWNEKYRLLRIV